MSPRCGQDQQHWSRRSPTTDGSAPVTWVWCGATSVSSQLPARGTHYSRVRKHRARGQRGRTVAPPHGRRGGRGCRQRVVARRTSMRHRTPITSAPRSHAQRIVRFFYESAWMKQEWPERINVADDFLMAGVCKVTKARLACGIAGLTPSSKRSPSGSSKLPAGAADDYYYKQLTVFILCQSDVHLM